MESAKRVQCMGRGRQASQCFYNILALLCVVVGEEEAGEGAGATKMLGYPHRAGLASFRQDLLHTVSIT